MEYFFATMVIQYSTMDCKAILYISTSILASTQSVVAEILHQNYQHRQSISIKKVKGEENCGTYVVVGGYKVCRDTTAVQWPKLLYD